VLRRLEPFFEWVDRDKPVLIVEAFAARFVLHAGRAPWLAPSVPEELLSDRPRSETRKVILPIGDEWAVYVLYRQHFELDGALVDEPVVDLLALSLSRL
jgi:hypothetical protein